MMRISAWNFKDHTDLTLPTTTEIEAALEILQKDYDKRGYCSLADYRRASSPFRVRYDFHDSLKNELLRRCKDSIDATFYTPIVNFPMLANIGQTSHSELIDFDVATPKVVASFIEPHIVGFLERWYDSSPSKFIKYRSIPEDDFHRILEHLSDSTADLLKFYFF